MVLNAPSRRIGTVAGDHDRTLGIEKERGGDVLSRQRGQGHRIGTQVPEQVAGQGRGTVEVAMFGVHDQGNSRRHQLAHLPQQLQSHRAQGLIEAEAGFVGADMVSGGFNHRLDPVPGQGEKRATAHAAALGPGVQHLRIGVQSGHQQGLVTGDGLSELDEETHRQLLHLSGGDPLEGSSRNLKQIVALLSNDVTALIRC